VKAASPLLAPTLGEFYWPKGKGTVGLGALGEVIEVWTNNVMYPTWYLGTLTKTVNRGQIYYQNLLKTTGFINQLE
jgi:hypothetical protein